MSMGFRMTVFSEPAQNRTSPYTKLDCFPLLDQTEAETVAFGYRARALVFEQRVRRTFGYPRHAPFRLTAGDGLAHQVPGEDFRSRFD
jgi:hypothetical protein